MIKKESGEKREFHTGAKKQYSKGKGTPALFPGDAYLEVCKHFEEGGVVHGDRNWEKGILLSELINSLERHIAQEKMGLTDESHDRAIAWNAIVYLATKLRIEAGLLPKELDDLEGVYGGQKEKTNISIRYHHDCGYYYVYHSTTNLYLWSDYRLHEGTDYHRNGQGCFSTKKAAEGYLKTYLTKRG